MNVTKDWVREQDAKRLAHRVAEVLRPPPPAVPKPTRDLTTYPTRLNPKQIVVSMALEGEPLSKGRPRFNLKTRTTYTPPETVERERTIGLLVKSQMRELYADDRYAFGIRVAFYLRRDQRKDLDNMLKLLFDALNKVVWRDDRQVHEIMAWCHRQEEHPRTELVVYRLEGSARESERACAGCGRTFQFRPRRADQKYCGRPCAIAARKTPVEVACTGCGARLQRKSGRAHAARTFWCSRACRVQALGRDGTCLRCGTTFRRPVSRARHNKYCSRACYQGRRAAP